MELALDENRSLAEYALKQIQELYHIEQIADARKLDAQGRCALRQRLATPILDSFEKWMEQTYGKVPPRSRMGQAITYTYPLWPRMHISVIPTQAFRSYPPRHFGHIHPVCFL